MLKNEQFHNSMLCAVDYATVREAMQDEHYTMSLVGDGAKIVEDVVNQGIDAHLEACYLPDRGDCYEWIGRRLNCRVSAESLPVLLRRLSEWTPDDDCESLSLCEDILTSLNFDDSGRWKGVEAD
jgi:hypothetical protein